MLPKPECELGYTEKQLKEIFGDRLEDFYVWAVGKTIARCDGYKYDRMAETHVSTGCGPHGYVTYPIDVIAFDARRSHEPKG